MKKVINEIPVLLYQDGMHEAQIIRELEASKTALQAVLNTWNNLDLLQVTDIYQLILNPQKVYGEAVDQLADPPRQHGRFQVSKEAYIQTLSIPIPDTLYQTAKIARQQPFCAVQGLWAIEGNKVILVESEAASYINSNNIYCSDQTKIERVKIYLAAIESLNSLNRELGGEILPLNHLSFDFFQGWAVLQYPDGRGSTLPELAPDLEYLRKLAK